jgi:D-lactate dehydrogenase
MKAILFNVRSYERAAFEAQNKGQHDLEYLDARLTLKTASAAAGFEAACCFVNDDLSAPVLMRLRDLGVRLIALRSAGYNHVNLAVAREVGLPVVRVPEYSPYAVAEHALALLMTLNRKTHRAYNRVRELNFSLEGLTGFDVHGKTVGVIGCGRIGSVFARLMTGFGCRVLISENRPSPAVEQLGQVVDLQTLLSESDIISLHVPLTELTRHLIGPEAFGLMRRSAILINTSRGALVDSRALILALKSGQIAGAALDVYEEEEGLFFQDWSAQGVNDDILARLLTFPNVLITAHQGFLTGEALHNIAAVTLQNLTAFEKGQVSPNAV